MAICQNVAIQGVLAKVFWVFYLNFARLFWVVASENAQVSIISKQLWQQYGILLLPQFQSHNSEFTLHNFEFIYQNSEFVSILISQIQVYIPQFWVCLNPDLEKFIFYNFEFTSYNSDLTISSLHITILAILFFFLQQNTKKITMLDFTILFFFCLKIARQYLNCEIKMLKLLKLFN